MEYTNTLALHLPSPALAQKAADTLAALLDANAKAFDKGYLARPSAKLKTALACHDCAIQAEGGFFTPEDIPGIMKELALGLAKALPGMEFSGTVSTDSTYAADDVTVLCADGKLHMNDVYYPDGYVEDLRCPECGEPIVPFAEFDPDANYTCPECGEEVDLHDDYEESSPVVTENDFAV